MTTSRRLWTWMLLASAGISVSHCKPSSDVSSAVREGGMPNYPAADGGGLGGQDGVDDDDDFRPPRLPMAGRRPPKPPVGGSNSVPGPDGSVVDPGPVDAGPPKDGGPNVPDAGKDAGPMPDPEDDAGEPECETSACLCMEICKRGVTLRCELEEPLDVCRSLCEEPVAGCDREVVAVQKCKAACPDEAYYCDEDFGAFVVSGCEAYDAMLENCRFR